MERLVLFLLGVLFGNSCGLCGGGGQPLETDNGLRSENKGGLPESRGCSKCGKKEIFTDDGLCEECKDKEENKKNNLIEQIKGIDPEVDEEEFKDKGITALSELLNKKNEDRNKLIESIHWINEFVFLEGLEGKGIPELKKIYEREKSKDEFFDGGVIRYVETDDEYDGKYASGYAIKVIINKESGEPKSGRKIFYIRNFIPKDGVLDLFKKYRGGDSIKTLYINFINESFWENVINLSYFLAHLECLKSVEFGDGFDTRNVKLLKGLFYGCKALSCVIGMSKWNIKNVTDTSEMFYVCPSLSTLPDISKWDTKNVTDMRHMFDGCSSLIALPDISKWDIKNVTNRDSMFIGCEKLTKTPDFKMK